MIMNYMNMGLDQPDPSVVQGYGGQPGSVGAPAYQQGAIAGPVQPQPGAQVIIDPRTGQPMMHPAGPNYGLGGWDGVNDKMRFLAQNARFNRAASQAVPGQSTSGMGGGGGGFGHLLHALLGGGPGAGAQ